MRWQKKRKEDGSSRRQGEEDEEQSGIRQQKNMSEGDVGRTGRGGGTGLWVMCSRR